MWAFLRRIVARSQILNSTLGEVVYETLKVLWTKRRDPFFSGA